MQPNDRVLVLGAYGLAGRAIVRRLAERTGYSIIAAGRSGERLAALLEEIGSDRATPLTLDATDAPSLGKACAEASFVINAVGPFPVSGAMIAGTVIECGKPYLDCANEQLHYRNLMELDASARRKDVPMITAAGSIPGLSTLLIAHALERYPDSIAVDCCWAQMRHAYADSGLASMMGGIIEAAASPVALRGGKPAPIVIGRSTKHFDLPEHFGLHSLLEVPTIDALTIPARYPLREFHTWFYMGDMPTWLLEIVRLLRPDRRKWAYRLIESVMRRINDRDTAKAIASGIGAECLLMVTARSPDKTASHFIKFRDGAVSTACLPAHIADRFLRGEISETGLLTPLDLANADDILALAEGTVLSFDLE
ncbi:MAG TPA: saccharopine dehydrogenase NADP-binding domain-containing protein [Candidatus Brocadiia bacterium]|nr:saccharopine dehydrogenase NADP-binding domain-containing protein [Candidatus Brocadiia bacterium]